MTPSKLKYRLKEQAKFFKYETDLIKGKVRELYKLAADAIELAEKLDAQVNVKKPSEPKAPPRPITYFKPQPPHPFQSRASRIKAFLSEGPDSPQAQRYLKWSRQTFDEAMKIVESESDGG